MVRRTRLDAELVRRGLARSRAHAADLVAAGRVQLAGRRADKVATGVAPQDAVRVLDGAGRPGARYASRGGDKLAGALDVLPVLVSGRRCLDAGASTGGFTDVLLQRGAAAVLAADVGYGQLAWALRTDERVTVLDRTNVRYLSVEELGGPVDLVVADLSFISLRLVLPALAGVLAPDGDLLPMVKPQFELGPDRVGRGGVVRDPALRAEAVHGVAAAARDLGLGVQDVAASPLPGPAGNREFFLWLRRDAPSVPGERIAEVTGVA